MMIWHKSAPSEIVTYWLRERQREGGSQLGSNTRKYPMERSVGIARVWCVEYFVFQFFRSTFFPLTTELFWNALTVIDWQNRRSFSFLTGTYLLSLSTFHTHTQTETKLVNGAKRLVKMSSQTQNQFVSNFSTNCSVISLRRDSMSEGDRKKIREK